MQASTTEAFLIALLLIFALPWLAWRVGRTEPYAPLVVVQILVGILLGPGALGAAFPDQYAYVFTPQVITALNGIAWWAVILFVWSAGVELDLHETWRRRGETGITAGLALLVPLVLGCAAALVLIAFTDGWAGADGRPWQVVLGIGMACAVTALPVLILLMDKLDVLRAPIGQRILRYASLDDIAIWAVLALLLLDWQRAGHQLAFIAAFILAAAAIRWIMVRLSGRDRWPAALVWLALCAVAAEYAGLHFMVGAFLAGVVLDADWFEREALDAFRAYVLLLLMPVYFLSTGLRTDWAIGGAAVFGAAALLLVASVGGKLAGVHLAGRLLGWAKGEASVIGWLLQTKALVMIVFANILLDKRIISGETFTALLLMAVASTMLTMPVVRPRLARLRGEGPEDVAVPATEARPR